jgi:hypothetical protein
VRGIAGRGGIAAVRVLLALAVFVALSGCEQTSFRRKRARSEEG